MGGFDESSLGLCFLVGALCLASRLRTGKRFLFAWRMTYLLVSPEGHNGPNPTNSDSAIRNLDLSYLFTTRQRTLARP